MAQAVYYFDPSKDDGEQIEKFDDAFEMQRCAMQDSGKIVDVLSAKEIDVDGHREYVITYECHDKPTTVEGYGITDAYTKTQSDGRFLQDEVDPVFLASPAGTITTSNKNQWTEAYGWGNHAGLYLPLNGGTMTLGEGLQFTDDGDYFGIHQDARIINILDTNGVDAGVDGGLVFNFKTTSDDVSMEGLRLRLNEFKWKGSEIQTRLTADKQYQSMKWQGTSTTASDDSDNGAKALIAKVENLPQSNPSFARLLVQLVDNSHSYGCTIECTVYPYNGSSAVAVQYGGSGGPYDPIVRWRIDRTYDIIYFYVENNYGISTTRQFTFNYRVDAPDGDVTVFSNQPFNNNDPTLAPNLEYRTSTYVEYWSEDRKWGGNGEFVGTITANGGNSNLWNTAYSWGNHALAGYLTEESDTLQSVTDRGATTTNSISVGSIDAGVASIPLKLYGNTGAGGKALIGHEYYLGANLYARLGFLSSANDDFYFQNNTADGGFIFNGDVGFGGAPVAGYAGYFYDDIYSTGKIRSRGAVIGTDAHSSDTYARFGHNDFYSSVGGYGFMQSASGDVFLSSPYSESIFLRNNNITRLEVHSFGVNVTGNQVNIGDLNLYANTANRVNRSIRIYQGYGSGLDYPRQDSRIDFGYYNGTENIRDWTIGMQYQGGGSTKNRFYIAYDRQDGTQPYQTYQAKFYWADQTIRFNDHIGIGGEADTGYSLKTYGHNWFAGMTDLRRGSDEQMRVGYYVSTASNPYISFWDNAVRRGYVQARNEGYFKIHGDQALYLSSYDDEQVRIGYSYTNANNYNFLSMYYGTSRKGYVMAHNGDNTLRIWADNRLQLMTGSTASDAIYLQDNTTIDADLVVEGNTVIGGIIRSNSALNVASGSVVATTAANQCYLVNVWDYDNRANSAAAMVVVDSSGSGTAHYIHITGSGYGVQWTGGQIKVTGSTNVSFTSLRLR